MSIPYVEIVYFISALTGGCMHYLKKRIAKETNVSFSNWFGKSNLPASIYTFVMFCIVIIGTIATGIVSPTMDICMNKSASQFFGVTNEDLELLNSD